MSVKYKHHSTQRQPVIVKDAAGNSIPPGTEFRMEMSKIQLIPDAKEMEALKAVDPSFPERLMARMEREQEDRHWRQRYQLKQEARSNIRNNFAGIFGVLLICGTGLIFMHFGHEEEGASIIKTCSVALASVFVIRKLVPAFQSDKK